MSHLIIGTRKSQLALWQAEHVVRLLRSAHPELEVSLRTFDTPGDRIQDKPLPQIGGKGLFTETLEAGLRAGEIDLAVHSLKDLPTTLDPDFCIGAIPARGTVFDVLVSRTGASFAALPAGATIGTSSLRRGAQIRAARPDLDVQPLRGNVPTRVEKGLSATGPYDAIILAAAGLERLKLDQVITELLSPELMLPAPAQGALGVQCRAADQEVLQILGAIDHGPTRAATEAERAFLNALDSGCRLPVAALAHFDGPDLMLTGRVISLDGAAMITVRGAAAGDTLTHLGQRLAHDALAQGAGRLLDAIRKAEGTL
jgi:hydroxymethylbilane synthase